MASLPPSPSAASASSRHRRSWQVSRQAGRQVGRQVGYSQLTTHCSLPTTLCLPLTTHYSLLTTYYLLPTYLVGRLQRFGLRLPARGALHRLG